MQSTSPPINVGWGVPYPLEIARAGVTYAGAWFSSSPDVSNIIPGLEKAVEPLSFIITTALRHYLAEGYKPSLEHYHITWDAPNEKKFSAATFARQGIDRASKGEFASREIINDWEDHTEKAINWYRPSTLQLQVEETLSLSEILQQSLGIEERDVKPIETRTKPLGFDTKSLESKSNQPLEEILNISFSTDQKMLQSNLADKCLQKVEMHLKVQRELNRHRQISSFFKTSIEGLESTKGPYKDCPQPRTKELMKKLDNSKKQISNALERSDLPRAIQPMEAMLIEESTSIWDAQSIEIVYNYFRQLEELRTQNKSSLQQKLMEDSVDAIEAIVTEKCTRFAMIQKKRRENF